MARLYFRKVKAGEMCLEDIPAWWREAVQVLMEGTGPAGDDRGGVTDGVVPTGTDPA